MINTRIKGLIFDLDGVLLSTDVYHYRAWKEVADKLGIDFDEKINSRLRGVGRKESLEMILSHGKKTLTNNEKEKLLKEKNDTYRHFLGELTPNAVSDETRKTLDELRRRGYKTAIGSSSKNTPIILEKTNLFPYFDAVSDGNSAKNTKPDPEIFRNASDKLNLENFECAVIEDAVSGIEASKRAGMTSVFYGNGKNDSADFSINNFSDLLKIFK